MEPLRVLVVGHGLIGAQRAAAIHDLGAGLPVRLAGTVDPIERAADLYGDAPHHRDLADVDPGGYQAAVIALPHDLAVAAAGEVLGAGKPILIEKPLGLSAGAARALESAADAIELPSFVGYNYRFLPHVRELFAAIDGDRLGKLRSIEMLIGHGGHPGSAGGWKLRPERGGGGVLIDPGVHLLDLLMRIDPELEARHLDGTRGFWDTGIEEDLVLVFRHDELLATIRVSHIRWINTLRIEVFGEDGYMLLEGRGGNYGPMTSRSGRRWGWRDAPQGRSQRQTEEVHEHGDRNRSLEDELESVAKRWLGEPAPTDAPQPASMAEGRRITELTESLYERLAV
jgi:predicted dehydrogenase